MSAADINLMSMQDLKTFIKEVEDDETKVTEPKNVDDLNNMSMKELKEFIEMNSELQKPKEPRPVPKVIRDHSKISIQYFT